MAESTGTGTAPKATLGLTGLTSNAMALIAPGAFLWLTYAQQSAYGAPMAGSAMWLGIGFALLLCLATAVAYAELSKLYPGAGSSYFFAEQAFLSKKQAFKWARVANRASPLMESLGGLAICLAIVYSGYLITHLAFLIAYPRWWNVIVVATADTALIARALIEERLLGGDVEYRAYCQRVGWHLVPGVF